MIGLGAGIIIWLRLKILSWSVHYSHKPLKNEAAVFLACIITESQTRLCCHPPEQAQHNNIVNHLSSLRCRFVHACVWMCVCECTCVWQQLLSGDHVCFSNSKSFQHCANLPHHNFGLHWKCQVKTLDISQSPSAESGECCHWSASPMFTRFIRPYRAVLISSVVTESILKTPGRDLVYLQKLISHSRTSVLKGIISKILPQSVHVCLFPFLKHRGGIVEELRQDMNQMLTGNASSLHTISWTVSLL